MGGYVTQKRDQKSLLLNNFTRPNGTSYPLDSVLKSTYQGQVTSSFRSMKKGEILTLDPENPTLAQAKSEYEFAGQYQKSKDLGHPFSTQKSWYEFSHPFTKLVGANGCVFKGVLLPRFIGTAYPTLVPAVVPVINTGYYGPKAIMNTIPTSPSASLLNALIELKRDGLPGPLVGQSFKHMKAQWGETPWAFTIRGLQALSSDFLNFQFGIVPLISDITSLLRSVVSSEKILTQYMRDSGRQVRRRYQFPKTEKTEVTFDQQGFGSYLQDWSLDQNPLFAGWNPSSPDSPPSGRSRARLHITRKVEESYNFAGAYTYFLDQGDNLLETASYYSGLANKLLGTELTPDVLWNAAPWSWLSDWYTNIGINISVASRFADPSTNLVISYGYLTRHYREEIVATVTGLEFLTFKPNPIKASYITTRQERVKSTPFGFGSSPASFTDRQWAILASLGMTRAPKVSW